MSVKTTTIKIAEGDGGIEYVDRALYDVVYSHLSQVLEASGADGLLRFVESQRGRAKPVTLAIMLTIVQRQKDGDIKLLTSDEADYHRGRTDLLAEPQA